MAEVLIDEATLRERIRELAAEIDRDYAGRTPLVVGVLNGAMFVVADLVREMSLQIEMDWMAVSSYRSGTKSSGVVRILKDLGADVTNRDVLLVEDVLDSGLTLNWLLRNLQSRAPRSVEVVALLRKPEARKNGVRVRYVGFDIADSFVVGYGLDYQQLYRSLRCIGVLAGPVPR